MMGDFECSPCLEDREVDGRRASVTSSDNEGVEAAAARVRLSPAGAENDSRLTNHDVAQLSVGSSSSCPGQLSFSDSHSLSLLLLFMYTGSLSGSDQSAYFSWP